MKIEPFCVNIDDGEIAQLERLLHCQKLSGSSELVQEYEACLARYFGVTHALAFSSGTAAIHGAIAALGIGPGDEVILSPAGTIEAVLAVLFQNAIPVFVDVERESFDLDLEDLRRKIGPRTKAVLCVPMWGYPMNVDAVVQLCAERGVPVIEDVALSVGASVNGRKLGTHGVIGCASTHERKLICTGEGGFTLTDDAGLANRMREFQRYGMVCRTGEPWDAIKHRAGYVLGWNYKINAFTAAVGISQIGKLDGKIATRRRNAHTIAARLADCAGVRPYAIRARAAANYYCLVVQIAPRDGRSAREVAARLKAKGIPSDTLEYDYRPLYEYPIFHGDRGYGGTPCPFSCPRYAQQYKTDACENAEAFMPSITTLPTHEGLTDGELEYVCETFRKVYASF
jgi:dTDP-4-amino-4,6-dideoxygalactose transaminase